MLVCTILPTPKVTGIELWYLGYAAELQYFPIYYLPIVRVPAELTGKGKKTKPSSFCLGLIVLLHPIAWDKMKDELINLMEYKRQEMRKTNITRTLQLRVYTLDRVIRSTMAQQLIVPFTSYIAVLEPFKTLLKTLPLEERVTEEELSALATPDILLQMTEAWRREADTSLLGLLSKPLPSNTDEAINRTPLELATTFFKCNWCTEPINYPRILMHRCLRNRCCKDTDDDDDDEEGDEGKVDPGSDDEVETIEAEDDTEHQTHNTHSEVTVDSVWNKISSWFGSSWNEGNDQIFVDEEATNFAETIVGACGEDPNTTTFARMEELDARLECVRCTAKSKAKTRNRLVMNWTTAVSLRLFFLLTRTRNSIAMASYYTT